MGALDCQRCGACCVSPLDNRAEGVTAYVDVREGEPILRRKDLVAKFVARDAAGRAHLRLTADHRCMALRGALGRAVHCGVYHHRPAPCRTVTPGDRECLRARRDHRIDG